MRATHPLRFQTSLCWLSLSEHGAGPPKLFARGMAGCVALSKIVLVHSSPHKIAIALGLV